MKKFIRLLLVAIILLPNYSAAQNTSSCFNTIGASNTQKKKVNDGYNENSLFTQQPLADSTEIRQSVIANNGYSGMSIDKLESLIEQYEKYLSRSQDNHTKCLITNRKSKVLSYYKGCPRELSLGNLLEVANEVGLSNHLFVLAQALLETGHFSSRVCKEYNNLFGLYDSKNHDYFRFARWEDSVIGYKRMIQHRYKGGNYLHFLRRIGYAEDARYINKVAQIAKDLYHSLFTKNAQ